MGIRDSELGERAGQAGGDPPHLCGPPPTADTASPPPQPRRWWRRRRRAPAQPSSPAAWTRCWASSPSPRSSWLRCGRPSATPRGGRSSWGGGRDSSAPHPRPLPVSPPHLGLAVPVGGSPSCPPHTLLSCTQVCPLGWGGGSRAPASPCAPSKDPPPCAPPKRGGKWPRLIKAEAGGEGLLLWLDTVLGPPPHPPVSPWVVTPSGHRELYKLCFIGGVSLRWGCGGGSSPPRHPQCPLPPPQLLGSGGGGDRWGDPMDAGDGDN